jgi:hypothetical protein
MRSTWFDSTCQTSGFQGAAEILPGFDKLSLIVCCGAPDQEMSRRRIVKAGAAAGGVCKINWKGKRYM